MHGKWEHHWYDGECSLHYVEQQGEWLACSSLLPAWVFMVELRRKPRVCRHTWWLDGLLLRLLLLWLLLLRGW